MPHYYSQKQSSPLKPIRITASVRGNGIEIISGSGVFSKDRIDKGSLFLANECIIEDNWKVLDLGCGYGVIGIAIAKSNPTVTVLMSDVNERAVSLAKKNIELNGLNNASAIESDVFAKIKGKFNTILLNPPQSAGKDLCYRMIEESKDHLEKNGLLQMVARHNIGGKELEKKMAAVFGNVKRIAKKSGYRIYVSRLE